MVSPQFVAETLVALERLGAQPTLNIFDGTISLAGRLPPLAAAGAPRLEASALAGAAGLALRGRSATIDEASEDGSTAALGSRASELDDSEALADDAVYDVFVSHCKRLDASEDRAVWVADVCEGAGLKVFFDRSDLTDISAEVLERSVKQSRVLVTVLDPYTFESVWCVRENRWAAAAGRPIVPIYDGDRHRWDTIKKWCGGHPHVFAKQAINYNKDYRSESKLRLLDSVRRAISEGRAVERPQIAHATSSHGLANAAASVRIGVAKSTKTDTAEATEAAPASSRRSSEARRRTSSSWFSAAPIPTSHRPTTSTRASRDFESASTRLARLPRSSRRPRAWASPWRANGSGATPSRSWASVIRRAPTKCATRTLPRGPRQSASASLPRPRGRIATGRRPYPSCSPRATRRRRFAASRQRSAKRRISSEGVSSLPTRRASPSLPAAAGATSPRRPASLCSSAGPPRPSRPRSSPARATHRRNKADRSAPLPQKAKSRTSTRARGAASSSRPSTVGPRARSGHRGFRRMTRCSFRPWLDEIDGRDPLWRAGAAVAAVCGQNAMGVRRAEGTVIVCVNDIMGGELEFLPGVEVFEGERLFPQFVDKTRICERTHEAAKEVCAKQGISDIRGAFTFSCALNVMLGEADGMQDVSDKMACALGSAPLFGMIGGPELGHAYGDKASFACVMHSCLVFQ